MHGAMGGGTNGAGHVNMGLSYKAYKAEQVSAMQVMVVGVHTEMAGYEQVGTLMVAGDGGGDRGGRYGTGDAPCDWRRQHQVAISGSADERARDAAGVRQQLH